MRVVVAPDKFAGTLSASQAAAAIGSGWLSTRPDALLTLIPMSDGGPGFVEVLQAATGGRIENVETLGPHGAPVTARLLWVGQDPVTAYLEAADCCGLHLAPLPRLPLDASSAGLVAPLRAALAEGAQRIVVGVGGTASSDGGRAVAASLAPWPGEVDLVVATDVENPLLGPTGAARGFAPQKGATVDQVAVLEDHLARWAAEAGVDPSLAGAGAGGGLAYGLMTLGARRVPGGEVVGEAVGLGPALREADLVVTGEGAVDFSSLRGKVVCTVGQAAMAAGCPCVVLAGRVEVGRREAAAIGLDELHAMTEQVEAAEALAQPETTLAALAARVARQWG